MTRPNLRKLSRAFYMQPTLTVARKLVGKFLIRKGRENLLVGRIVEVEAYLGELDPASHAYRGQTMRNSAMFRQGGHLYVYFTYGMHYCCNVVAEKKGKGRAILIRAVEPLQGLRSMAKRRKLFHKNDQTLDQRVLIKLCSGPAKLCQAFGIDLKDNGLDLCRTTTWIAEEPGKRPTRVLSSSRIGITDGLEHLWRFYDGESPFVSRKRPATRLVNPA
jgi:DNA-3-methyladenine glycosylase